MFKYLLVSAPQQRGQQTANLLVLVTQQIYACQHLISVHLLDHNNFKSNIEHFKIYSKESVLLTSP